MHTILVNPVLPVLLSLQTCMCVFYMQCFLTTCKKKRALYFFCFLNISGNIGVIFMLFSICVGILLRWEILNYKLTLTYIMFFISLSDSIIGQCVLQYNLLRLTLSEEFIMEYNRSSDLKYILRDPSKHFLRVVILHNNAAIRQALVLPFWK